MSQPTLKETRSDIIDCLYEDLICLCEIRGELSEELNAYTEARIKAIQKQIKELEAA